MPLEQHCQHCKKWLSPHSDRYKIDEGRNSRIYNLSTVCRECELERSKNLKQNMESRFNKQRGK